MQLRYIVKNLEDNCNVKVILNGSVVYNANPNHLKRGNVSTLGGTFFRDYNDILNRHVIKKNCYQWNSFYPKNYVIEIE